MSSKTLGFNYVGQTKQDSHGYWELVYSTREIPGGNSTEFYYSSKKRKNGKDK